MSRQETSVALPGQLQPPMMNGEVVFEAPWQGRVFGMAVALHEAGCFEWEEFQASLIAAVGAWDAASSEPYAYYVHFERALQELLQAKGMVGDGELNRRSGEFAERSHGHDHPVRS
jgi:nitrile hydratase accessory protein